jgi:ubiquitin-like 1-activating enzyme E1 B
VGKFVGLHANIKEARFGVDFFRQFSLVMNALDNIDARRHVNRLCLAARVPLIESGTAGFLGQAQVIIGGRTECYECRAKAAPKTFAVCTIRSTPSKPVHCVVWAKDIFGELFGPAVQTGDGGGGGGGDEDEFAGEPDACLADALIAADAERLEREGREHGASRLLFYKQFHHDIFRRMRVADIAGKQPWKERSLPRPLTFDAALALTGAPAAAAGESERRADQRVPSVAACAAAFVAAADRLAARAQRVAFDKDDDDAMAFVSAAANLRSYVFDIPLLSDFQIKSIAGNIVPAIATTNAVIAGFIVIEALKVLGGRLGDIKTTYLTRQLSSGRKLLAANPDEPNRACFVCQKATQTLTIDTEQTTLAQLLHVLRAELSFVEPQIMLGNSVKYESGDGLESDERETFDANLERTLAQLAIVHGAMVTVDDFAQELSVMLIVSHAPRAALQGKTDEHTVLYRLEGERPKVAVAAAASTGSSEPHADESDDDDEPLEIITPAHQQQAPPPPPLNAKRTANQIDVVALDDDDDDDDDQQQQSKKAKV